jgi:hypothetical protein
LSAKSYVLAEYPSEEAIYAAARRLRGQGHASLDIHSPYPLHGSDEALGLGRSKVPLICLAGALVGIAGALLMQWWMNAVDYPINVGNRLLIPYPAMIPVTFELGVLLASGSVFFGMLGLFGFPRTHHPLFEVEAFRSAAVDALWLSVEVKPEQAESVAEELRRLGATQVATAAEAA